jgi:hypothetical protein
MKRPNRRRTFGDHDSRRWKWIPAGGYWLYLPHRLQTRSRAHHGRAKYF